MISRCELATARDIFKGFGTEETTYPEEYRSF
jgi:hypothetical protein